MNGISGLSFKYKNVSYSTCQTDNYFYPKTFRTFPPLSLHELPILVIMAPNAETDDINSMTSDFSKVHSLKAAIFHTMAFKLSLEINKNKITPKCLMAFLKVLYNVTQIKKKKLHLSNTRASTLKDPKLQFGKRHPMFFFVLNSSFTSKDQYFRTALQEATDAFNNMLKDFGYTQKLKLYDPLHHQTHPPSQNSLFQ